MIDTTHQGTRASNALGLAKAKRCIEAYEESRASLELAPNNTMMLLALAGVHSLCGKPRSADSLLKQIGRRPDAPMMGIYFAQYYAAHGKPDSAFAWLDRAYLGMGSVSELRMNRDFDPLRSDPRYRQLLARLNMP